MDQREALGSQVMPAAGVQALNLSLQQLISLQTAALC